jgi:GT2 family glycosyltransferase
MSRAEGPAVVVVSFNTREHLRACLASVRAEAPGEVIVVDNASSDGSAEMVRTEFQDAVLHANSTNLGYGAAANQGIRACRARYTLLLNGDTRVHPGVLAAMEQYLDEHQRAAVVGPRLLNPDGTLQPSCFPFLTPFNVLVLNTGLNKLVRLLPFARKRLLPVWPHTHPRVVPWVKGAALAIRREAFESVGGFDVGYFMYAEELDLCFRLRARGWETHFAPVANVVHVEAASTMQFRPDMAARLFASIQHFYQQHYSPAYLRRFRWVIKAIMLKRILRDTILRWLARDPAVRRRLAGDLLLWRRIIRERRQ